MAVIRSDYFANEYFPSDYFADYFFGIKPGSPTYADKVEFDLHINRVIENSLPLNRMLETSLSLNTRINFEIER